MNGRKGVVALRPGPSVEAGTLLGGQGEVKGACIPGVDVPKVAAGGVEPMPAAGAAADA